jgi:sortase A
MGLMSQSGRARRWGVIELAALLALAIGLVCIAESTWIRGKAVLAQLLIARAWGQAQAGVRAPKPWPWADTTPIAKLELPVHANHVEVEELMVLDGASGRNLAFGPTHDPASV